MDKPYMCSQCGDEYDISDDAVFCCDFNSMKERIAELREELFQTTADLETAQAQLDAVRGLPTITKRVITGGEEHSIQCVRLTDIQQALESKA